MIIASFDGFTLLVTSIEEEEEEVYPIKVIHISEFRRGKPNGYRPHGIKAIIGTKEDNPELLI